MGDKHTPGPWNAVLETDTRGQPSVLYGGIICLLEHSPERRLTVVTDGRACKPEERAANARLIASAPELLEACRRLIAVNDECVAAVQRGVDPATLGERFSATLPAVRAAIAKAEGSE